MQRVRVVMVVVLALGASTPAAQAQGKAQVTLVHYPPEQKCFTRRSGRNPGAAPAESESPTGPAGGAAPAGHGQPGASTGTPGPSPAGGSPTTPAAGDGTEATPAQDGQAGQAVPGPADSAAPAPAPVDDSQPENQPGSQPDGIQPIAPTADSGEPAPQASETTVQATSSTPSLKAEEPPISWTEWAVGGPLPEAERAKLQTILEAQMQQHPNLGRADRCTLQEFVNQQLGYYLAGITVEDRPGTGKRVIIEIEPVTRVRRVKVEVLDQSVDDLLWLDTVFNTEITRRMRLRAGSELASEPNACAGQLRYEEARIRQYLRSKGYFDAKVNLGMGLSCADSKPDAAPVCFSSQHSKDGLRPAAANLTVCVTKGRRYELDIDRIRVEGNTAVPTDEIRAKFRHGELCLLERCLFERFSEQNLNEDVQEVEALYKKRGYPAVRVRTDFDPDSGASFDRKRGTVQFTVHINERRRIDVVFEGNDPERFSDEALKSLLTFNEEGSYDNVEIVASASAIRRYYQARGYFEVNVTHERVDLGVYERIVFTIYPGPNLRVRSVDFAGNRALSADELHGVVQTEPYRSSPLFGTVGNPTSEDLARDARAIAELYRQRGYSQVEVQIQVSRSPEVMDNAAALAALVAGADAKDDGLYVRFVIREGPQVLVNSIDFVFQGEHRRSAADLARLLSLKPGDPFIAERIDDARDRIGRHYFENAHPRATVTRRVCPSATPGRVDVVYEIAENQEVRFGKVVVHGNFKTKDWVILNELGFEEGKPLTLSRAEAGQENLRASGLFNAVQVRFLDLQDGKSENVHVVVDVQERYDYWLGLEAAGGFSSDSGGFVEGAVFNSNVLGYGLRLDLRGQYGQEFQSVETRLVVPRWLTERFFETVSAGLLEISPRFEASAFWRRDETERFGQLTSYGASGVISKVGRRGFFQGWLLSLRYDLRQRNRNEALVRGPGPSDDFEQATLGTRTGAIGPQLIIDKRKDASGRPNPLTPEAGFRIDLRAQYASRYLGGQYEFIKLGASAQHFWKPAGRLLLTNGIRYDHGIPLEGYSLLPDVERYFAGGDTTVRGFEEDRLATEIIEEAVPPLQDVTRVRVLPVGGNVRFIHNLDLQIRVWQLLGVPVASAIFLDTGLVTNSLQDFAAPDLRHALGVALFRWVAAFGSLSLEYAIPLDPKHTDQGAYIDNPRGRFHINFGLLF